MKPGKTIFKAGEPADGLYIVGSGEVGIYFPTNKEMAEPDITLKANEILGEMGVIDTAPRMATAKVPRAPSSCAHGWFVPFGYSTFLGRQFGMEVATITQMVPTKAGIP